MTNEAISTSGEPPAIAALDAYSQNYGDPEDVGIEDVGTNVGLLTILPLSDFGIPNTKADEWVSASFSATTYKLNAPVGNLVAGTTVIAFRGIDGIPDWSIWFARRRGVNKAYRPARARE